MKRHLLLVLISATVLVIFALPTFAQEDMEVIENYGFSKKQRPPAVFRHDEHNENAEIEECNECHHVYEDGERLEDESSEDQSCADCHSEKGSDNAPRLIKAFHLNCKGCHQAAKKGPIMCGECHVR
jgi:hypothetical protein